VPTLRKREAIFFTALGAPALLPLYHNVQGLYILIRGVIRAKGAIGEEGGYHFFTSTLFPL